MSKISEKKKDKIKGEILGVLYEHFPKMIFTNKIADEIARNNEFVLKLLNEMEELKWIKKNKRIARTSWGLTLEIYNQYEKMAN
ncbi:hypothetical protein J4425_02125 [Candidatus Woesearchaeota archaeon]|nr:hypothetical protein [Candidatus Woesearchaeota archaeon]